MTDSNRKDGIRAEEGLKQAPLEKTEQVNGKQPEVLIGFIRGLNFFKRNKDKKEEVDFAQFVRYITTHLEKEVRLLSLPAKAHFTKQAPSWAKVVVSVLEDSGYAEPGRLPCEISSQADVKTIINVLITAIRQAMSDFRNLSPASREKIIDESRPLDV